MTRMQATINMTPEEFNALTTVNNFLNDFYDCEEEYLEEETGCHPNYANELIFFLIEHCNIIKEDEK